ncbi:MAG: hypothetical protein ACRDJU_08905 [Actinomycetota bacterium]
MSESETDAARAARRAMMAAGRAAPAPASASPKAAEPARIKRTFYLRQDLVKELEGHYHRLKIEGADVPMSRLLEAILVAGLGDFDRIAQQAREND